MSLKISLPTLISCLTGTFFTVSYLIINTKPNLENNLKNKKIEVEDTSPVVAEYVNYDERGSKFCYMWKEKNLISQAPPTDLQCPELSPELILKSEEKGRRIQKIKVKSEFLTKTLNWHNLSKPNDRVNLWLANGGWNCKSEKINNESNQLNSKILVSCMFQNK